MQMDHHAHRDEWRTPPSDPPLMGRFEFPLSANAIAGLRAEVESTRRTGIGCGAFVGAVAVVCLGLSLLNILRVEPVLVIFCGFMCVPLATHIMRFSEDQLRADANEGVAVCLVGPVELQAIEHEESATTYTCAVLDEEFPIGLSGFLQLAKCEWAVIAYLPHTRRVLEMRDGTGARVA
jgi:hypothetical protein